MANKPKPANSKVYKTKQVRRNEEKKSKEKNEVLLWEDLIPLAEGALEMLSTYEKVLNEVLKVFNPENIENEELKKSIHTLTNIRDTIKNDLAKLLALHAETKEVDGKKTIVFRKGRVNADDDDESTLFVTTSLAYSNITTQLIDLVKVVTKNLLMDIAESVDKEVKKEVESIINEDEGKEDDGKQQNDK